MKNMILNNVKGNLNAELTVKVQDFDSDIKIYVPKQTKVDVSASDFFRKFNIVSTV